MSDSKRKPLIAHVRCAEPPPGLTLREWRIWRLEEDARMADELAAQGEAIMELLAGATIH